MNAKEIAQTIVDQIKAADPSALMAWGARSFASLSEQKIADKLQLGGLMFRVSGAKYRGWVVVRLMANDLYQVEIGRMIKLVWKPKHILEEVFCDELMTRIDNAVERDAA